MSVPDSVSAVDMAIREQIAAEGSISFARFMELALYHPAGYYSRAETAPGREGDFWTAAQMHPLFGRMLGRQVGDMWERLGRPQPFTVIEPGAGGGEMAQSLLRGLREESPELYPHLRYRAIERSPSRRELLSSRLAEHDGFAAVDPEATDPEPGPGVVLAHEFFDALPVHRVRRRGDRIVEVRVGLDDGGSFVETEVDADEPLVAWCRRFQALSRDGDEAEVCLEAPIWTRRLLGTISSGYMIVIDYGHRSDVLYDERHRAGTLKTYHRHRAGDDALVGVGAQDITAHVNFSALEAAAQEAGGATAAWTNQERFLVALGIAEEADVVDGDQLEQARAFQHNRGIVELIHPEGMGRMFKVLVVAKNARTAGLRGLANPYREVMP